MLGTAHRLRGDTQFPGDVLDVHVLVEHEPQDRPLPVGQTGLPDFGFDRFERRLALSDAVKGRRCPLVDQRVIIALTDGNDTGSQVPPAEAARAAAEAAASAAVITAAAITLILRLIDRSDT